ncbi:MAG: hypothetical protein AAB739_05535 [Patescibacteria group bacterium]|mgnify:FL=1
MKNKILNNPLSAEVLALMAASQISYEEKQLWYELLPHMTDDEKKRLIGNLEKQINHELGIEEEAVNALLGSMES